jgi:DNA-binding transcriptional ArsR family regulator
VIKQHAHVIKQEATCGETVEDGRLAPAVDVLAALAHTDRLRMLVALGVDELPVNHLTGITDLAAGEIQQHLTTLETVGVVSSPTACGPPVLPPQRSSGSRADSSPPSSWRSRAPRVTRTAIAIPGGALQLIRGATPNGVLRYRDAKAQPRPNIG